MKNDKDEPSSDSFHKYCITIREMIKSNIKYNIKKLINTTQHIGFHHRLLDFDKYQILLNISDDGNLPD